MSSLKQVMTVFLVVSTLTLSLFVRADEQKTPVSEIEDNVYTLTTDGEHRPC